MEMNRDVAFIVLIDVQYWLLIIEKFVKMELQIIHWKW